MTRMTLIAAVAVLALTSGVAAAKPPMMAKPTMTLSVKPSTPAPSLESRVAALESQLVALSRTPGPAGPQGPAGPPGPQGPAGGVSVSAGGGGFAYTRDQIYVRSSSVTLAGRSNNEASVTCDDGNDVLLFGGYDTHSSEPLVVTRSAPLPFFARATWVVSAINTATSPMTLDVTIYCARVS